nr:glycosyltransferase family 2 protein [Parabacteroides goldsteinii]
MISIITINYNGIVDTRAFLYSFRKCITDIEYEVIVVDNASMNNEAAVLMQEFQWIRCVRSEENLGFSGGNNLGVKYARGNLFLFLNNDLIFKSDFITPLLKRINSQEEIGAISPRIIYMDNSLCYGGCEPIGRYLLRIHYINGDLTNGLPFAQEVPLAHGAAVLIRREVLEKVKGWPDIYFLYSEEVDLSIKIKKLGYSIWYEPESTVFHLESQSTGKGSPLVFYYNTRNRLLLYLRNLEGVDRIISIGCQLLLNLFHISQLLISGKFTLAKSVFIGTMDFLRGNFYRNKR